MERRRTDSVEHQVFFQQMIRQARPAVGAAVGSIDHHAKARGRLDRRGLRRRAAPEEVAVGRVVWAKASRGARVKPIARQARRRRSSIQRIDGKTTQ